LNAELAACDISDDGGLSTAVDALDRPQHDLAVRRRLARLYAELALERRQDLLRAAQSAADVRADLDQTPPDWREMEHVVEGRDPLAVGGGELQGLADLLERLRRQPASVPLL